jgi:hypothetical protein
MLRAPARGACAAARAILPQRIEHHFADRLAGLARQRARELRGFRIADMNLVLHGGCSDKRHGWFA